MKTLIETVYGLLRYALPNIGEAWRNWQFDRRVAKLRRDVAKREREAED